MTDAEDRVSRRMLLRGGTRAALREDVGSRLPTRPTKGVEPVSRRMFLCGSAALALLAVAPPAWARRAVSATRGAVAATPRSLTRSRFEPILGGTLRMTGGGHNIDVVLAEITDLLPVLRAHDPHRFALLLHAHGSHQPVSGIRTFHHDDLGDVALFVSPVDRGIGPTHYEAVVDCSCS